MGGVAEINLQCLLKFKISTNFAPSLSIEIRKYKPNK